MNHWTFLEQHLPKDIVTFCIRPMLVESKDRIMQKYSLVMGEMKKIVDRTKPYLMKISGFEIILGEPTMSLIAFIVSMEKGRKAAKEFQKRQLERMIEQQRRRAAYEKAVIEMAEWEKEFETVTKEQCPFPKKRFWSDKSRRCVEKEFEIRKEKKLDKLRQRKPRPVIDSHLPPGYRYCQLF